MSFDTESKNMDKVIEIKFRQHTYTTTHRTIYGKGECPLTVLLECEDVKDSMFIDKDGTHFGKVLNYLSDNRLPGASSKFEKEDIEYLFNWCGFNIVDVKVESSKIECADCTGDVMMICKKCGQYLCYNHSDNHTLEIGEGEGNEKNSYRCSGNRIKEVCHVDDCFLFGNICVTCDCMVCEMHGYKYINNNTSCYDKYCNKE